MRSPDKFMSTLVVLQQMIVIFLLILSGFALTKLNLIGKNAAGIMSSLVVYITNPAIQISSVLGENSKVTHADVLYMLLVTLVIYIILTILGIVLPRLFGVQKAERCFYNLMTVYVNSGFIGLPLVLAVLGSEAVIYATIFNLVYTFWFYTHGIIVLQKGRSGEKEKIDLKKIFNIGTISGIIAILIFWFGWRLPTVFEDTITYMGRATTFLAMAVLGVNLAGISLKSLFTDIRLLVYSLVRLLALPIAIGTILRIILGDSLMMDVFILLIAMPAGNLPLMAANQYNMKAETLTRGILLTTILSLVTITGVVALV